MILVCKICYFKQADLLKVTMKQSSDYCGFIQQLPIVFEILKHNPDSIVDDTAIERLLNWIEVMLSKLSSVECCIDFLTCDEIWQQPTAFSFALRHVSNFSAVNTHSLFQVILLFSFKYPWF